MPLHTISSSSLTPIHQPCQNILPPQSDMPIAPAVNLYTHPSPYPHLTPYPILSKAPTCRTFTQPPHPFLPRQPLPPLLLN
ncbi:beta-ketoacyl synthase N-terminal-like domain-containing protein, partial [Bacillus velezensis]|uniref:beta-ketoacyl synthase N-terminal-like domain-containing protein n=1 Tax=Bacillus velezensis TaxID=492670 RepID=UPI0037BFCA3F